MIKYFSKTMLTAMLSLGLFLTCTTFIGATSLSSESYASNLGYRKVTQNTSIYSEKGSGYLGTVGKNSILNYSPLKWQDSWSISLSAQVYPSYRGSSDLAEYQN